MAEKVLLIEGVALNQNISSIITCSLVDSNFSNVQDRKTVLRQNVIYSFTAFYELYFGCYRKITKYLSLETENLWNTSKVHNVNANAMFGESLASLKDSLIARVKCITRAFLDCVLLMNDYHPPQFLENFMFPAH